MSESKGKQVVDVKGQEEKKPVVDEKQEVQVNPGNVGLLTIKILAAILDELKSLNKKMDEDTSE